MPAGLGSKSRLYAEVRLLEISVLSPLSLGYRPGTGCREMVKGLGAVTESFPERRRKPGLSLALELAFETWSCTSASIPGGGAGQPRRNCLPSCSRHPRDRRSSMNVS